MNVRHMAPLLAAVLATACTTPQTLREKVPAFSGKSDKSKDQIVGCIATGWAEFSGYQMTSIPTQDRTTLMMGGGGTGPNMIADIYADGRVEVQKRTLAWFGFDKRMIAVVQGCL